VDDVLDWLVAEVDLPQYVDNFRINDVGGRILPRYLTLFLLLYSMHYLSCRLAANGQYLTSILGIKAPVHRQKIALKSTDTVLFGPPRREFA
jgi:stromal interaction molecule 1